MGLDMYLSKKIYIGAHYEHNKVTGEITIKKNGELVKINLNKVSEVTERVGYWRKANHIHSWFVKNVQNGEDDCKEYTVEKEQLGELLDLCTLVLKDHSLASQLLPTEEGFFFGSTDYDEYYYSDLADTVKILTEVLKDQDYCEYTYQSSW